MPSYVRQSFAQFRAYVQGARAWSSYNNSRHYASSFLSPRMVHIQMFKHEYLSAATTNSNFLWITTIDYTTAYCRYFQLPLASCVDW